MKDLIYYVQEVEMTDVEKKLMYSKLKKSELIEILIEANKHLKYLSEVYNSLPTQTTSGGLPWQILTINTEI